MTPRTRRLDVWLTRAVVFAMLLVAVAGPLPRAPGRGGVAGAGTAEAAAKFDRAVWEALSASPDGTAEAILYLDAQADLSFAESMDDWDARGWAVYNALRATADSSQERVLETLARQQADGHVAQYQSFWIVDVIVVRGDRDGLLAAAALPEVAQVLAPPKIETPDPEPVVPASSPNAVEWGIAMINADDVWATYGVTGTGAVVANVDTGVEYTHTALVNQYRGNLGGGGAFDHNYNWWDADGSLAPYDPHGHGTHTMGTMVGWDGAANQIGVAPGAKWIAAGFDNVYSLETRLGALQWIVAPTRLDGSGADPARRPDVNSNSWGWLPSGNRVLDKAISAQRASGVLPVFAAGNDGPLCGTALSPGDNPAVFNVGATTSADGIAGWSARGPDPFGSDTSPQVSAPGQDVRSSFPHDTYALGSGTSMATPHVASSAALLISLEPKLRGQVGQIEELLRKTVDPKTSTQTCGGVPGSEIPNNTFGWGRINVKGAADMIYHAGWLSGTVTAGGAPVTGTLISFANTAYTYTLTTRTDGLGHYKVLAGAGTWDMSAEAYEYQTATASGLVVTQDSVTVQDFTLTALPTYTVSGLVRDAATSAGVQAYLEIAKEDMADPDWAQADGSYALVLPQGTYSLTVSHPGYQPQTVNLSVTGTQTLDINLTARLNYTCLDSRDPGGPVYNWLEASDGTPHNLGDDGNLMVALPTHFTYFGTDYTGMYANANGFASFGGSAATAGLMVPHEGRPNSDILAFNEDLNPASGTQGIVYHKFDGTKVIVQYEAVQHYPSGYPETFQVILDTADDSILVQYKTLSLTDIASGGLEDGTGTVGQLWNYADSAPLANGLAVKYAPATGNAVNWGCDHVLWVTANPTLGVMTYAPDHPIRYVIAGDVIGQYGAPGVVLTAAIPHGTSFVQASPGGVLQGNVVVWDFGNARAKKSGLAWFEVQPQSWLPNPSWPHTHVTLADAAGQSRSDVGQVLLRNPGPLPPNSVLIPIAARNGAP